MLEIIENEKESNRKKPPKHIADFDLKERKKFAEELGLPGFIFMTIIIWCGFHSSYQLLKLYKLDSQKRCIIATLISLTAAQMLIMNKQGSLGGIPVFFTQVIVIMRIFLNEKDVEHEYSSENSEQVTTHPT